MYLFTYLLPLINKQGGSVQGQIGWRFEQLGVAGVPAHGRSLKRDGL